EGRPVAARAHITTGPVVARGVWLDQTAGTLHWTPHQLRVEDILLRTGPSEARGRYTMDPASRDFRFLLDGHLQPEAIRGWFRDWWPRFWSRFDFSQATPGASVDVQGRWGE